MLTPEGKPAKKIDKVMLLNMWAKFLAKEPEKKTNSINQSMIYAGMGKPTYPLHPDTSKFLATYWNKHNGEAIDYGDPQGDLEARELMSKAMSNWYGHQINANDILFTVGGVGALHSIFAALKSYYADIPNFRVITPFPYYTLYADNDLRLHPIPVMDNPGYRLNAESLLKSIQSAETLAKEDLGYPRALLLCDPNNPLGSVLGEKELKKIAEVLRAYPDLTIILDEAYAELVLDGTKHVSLLTVAPDLKSRIILMRSATKGLSAAGERMAITLAFNPSIMISILEHSIRNYGHAPRSLQMAYAKTMENFTDAHRIEINNFYRQKVDYVRKRLAEMGAVMPDSQYQVQGAFYILADFKELMGEPLPPEASRILEKKGTICSDEDIAYTLLDTDNLMVSPASYYGVNKNHGYLRITCSAELETLHDLMDRLEQHLRQIRLKKLEQLKHSINEQLARLKPINSTQANKLSQLMVGSDNKVGGTTLNLKKENKMLEQQLLTIKRFINLSTTKGQVEAATIIQSAYRGHRARKDAKEIIKAQDKEWFNFVERVSPQPNNGIRSHLERLTVAERLDLKPWKEHLKEKESSLSANFLMNFLNNTTLNSYTALLVFIGLASAIAGSLGLASMGVIGLTAASIVGVSALTIGIGFFSTTIKNHFSSESSAEKHIEKNSPFSFS